MRNELDSSSTSALHRLTFEILAMEKFDTHIVLCTGAAKASNRRVMAQLFFPKMFFLEVAASRAMPMTDPHVCRKACTGTTLLTMPRLGHPERACKAAAESLHDLLSNTASRGKHRCESDPQQQHDGKPLY